ncbi:MAG: S-methyl-5'-thioadenosine phosphorylase [Candidatus Thiosymbion ectosymbiont of Robbea hypermnestra]|nr:S-methyl-5'-thioadenosine phosphorylase [Candidatus Thiosymbion ectosymbiont of Robbea hypermnestra]
MGNKNTNPVLGIIGGSGVYEIDGLTNTHWEKLSSPFGEPSDSLLFGELDGQQMVFLPRHGRGHQIPPCDINFRANVDVLKRAGVTDVISVSAVGSLREHLRPGMFVIVDQFIDRTFARKKSFFGTGLVAHVSMAHPVCNRLGDHIEAAAREVGIEAARGGTYLVMEGPQFSSLAESELYRTWNCDVIGMTNMPEAKLAREAEICYATVAMVTDYDCWHPNHDDVTVDVIVQVLRANADNARSLVKKIAPRTRTDWSAQSCGCRAALEYALITPPEGRDPELVKRLDAVAGRMLNSD